MNLSKLLSRDEVLVFFFSVKSAPDHKLMTHQTPGQSINECRVTKQNPVTVLPLSVLIKCNSETQITF